jgi:hypothetical protein
MYAGLPTGAPPTRPLSEIENELIATVNALGAHYDAEYSALRATDPERAEQYFFDLWPAQRHLAGRVSEPRALKYVRGARAHITKWAPTYFQFFGGLKSAYEIGVGPGYLLRLMIDHLGLQMSGCDVSRDATPLFDDIRRAIGVSHLVEDHKVTPRQEIPITPGAEALLAFQTVFNFGFTLDDHRWFLEQCRQKLSGPKKVFILFNAQGFDDEPEVQAFYRARAQFPFDDPNLPGRIQGRDRNAFCILGLGEGG